MLALSQSNKFTSGTLNRQRTSSYIVICKNHVRAFFQKLIVGIENLIPPENLDEWARLEFKREIHPSDLKGRVL